MDIEAIMRGLAALFVCVIVLLVALFFVLKLGLFIAELMEW